MSERLSIENTGLGPKFIDTDDTKHGKEGQVRKATLLGRSVTVQGRDMNAGSLIDFLNTKVAPDKQLTKGWFFGYIGGSSDAEIQALFNELYQVSPKEKAYFLRLTKDQFAFMELQFLKRKNISVDHVLKSKETGVIKSAKTKILAGFDDEYKTAGVFVMEHLIYNHKKLEYEYQWVLHICLPKDVDDPSNVLDQFLNKSIDSLTENWDAYSMLPKHYCFENSENGETLFKEWQQRNR